MTENKELYQEWLTKAHQDEGSAKAILNARDEGGGFPGTVCFLAQQSAEKLLKGLLVAFGKKYPKTHDLIKIASFLAEETKGVNQEEIEDLTEGLVVLNSYYIEARYPGDVSDFTWPEAEKAIEYAEKIKRFVSGKIE